MADSMVLNADRASSDCSSVSSNGSLSLGQRKIEFHPARKPLSSTESSNGGGDFRPQTLNPSTADFHQPDSNTGRQTKKSDVSSECFENGWDPELSFEITFRKIGAGLENLGNTCFLNSVLQCLTYTEPLAAYLKSGKHQNSCHRAGFCALCSIQNHVNRALQSSGRILAPKDLVSNLRCISRNFRNSRQEDAHEYMVNLLESMHKCCLPSGLSSETPIAYEKSLVHKIFGGSLRSQVKCMQCSSCSNTYDPFLDLSLDIVNADSLHKALKQFTVSEMLDGGEKHYQCHHCNQKVRACKQLTVYKAPNVLTIHLKRFHWYYPDVKIHKKIHFGPTLDFKPFVSGSDEGNLNYTLYGVLVHKGGTTHSGHYYCFVRTSSGMWYALDDNEVFHVSEKTVYEQQAYMLFYVRDRKKVASPKSSDNSNVTSLIISCDSKDPVQNGLSGDRSGKSSTDLTGPEADTVASVTTTNLKETSDQSLVTECSLSRKDSLPEPASEMSVTKEPLQGTSVPISNLEAHLSPSTQSVDTNITACNTENANGVENLGIESCGANRDSGDSAETSPDNSDPESCFSSTPATIKTPQKDPEVALNTSVKADTRILPDQLKSENSEVVDIPVESALIHPSCIDTDKENQEPVPSESNKSSSSSITTSGSVGKPNRKVKKKLLKCQAASLHLSSQILFGRFLSLEKRKKQKRRKRCAIDTKNLTQVDVFASHYISSDLGPSTSEKTRSVSSVSSQFQKKRTRNGSKGVRNETGMKNVNSDGESVIESVDENYKKRKSSREDVILNTPQKVLLLSGPGCRLIQRKSASEVYGFTSMLTQGIEETVEALWDGIKESPPSSDMVESNCTRSLDIGYIADEWDEDYDRGKRKKVRHAKPPFSMPNNPFQLIAAQRSSKLKMTKRKHMSSSSNRPYRI